MTPKYSHRFSSALKAALYSFCTILGLLGAARSVGAVDASVSPDTLVSDSITKIAVTITGLTPGETVIVERYVDANANGVIDPGEFLVESHVITDGAVTEIGGIRNVNVPGDEDLTVDGAITYTFAPRFNAEFGRLAGAQLIRVSSPSNAFAPLLRTFTLTQPVHAQSISGTVRSGGAPVPFAAVVLLAVAGEDMDFVGGAHADAQGNYTISAAPGNYVLIAMRRGFVASLENAQFVDLAAESAVADMDLQLIQATTSISGRLTYAGTTDGAAGVQIFAETEDAHLVVASTGPDGSFEIPVTANHWGISPSEISLALLGCLRPDDDVVLAVDTTDGSVSGAVASITRGTALLYGTVTDQNDNGVANIFLGASNHEGFAGDARTDASGYYVIAVAHGAWSVWFSDESPALAGYLPPSGTFVEVQAGHAVLLDHVLAPVTAHIAGIVTQDNAPRARVRVGAYNQQTNAYVRAETDETGAFSLGVAAGTWFVQLESAAELQVVSPVHNISIEDNETISDVELLLRTANAQISGSVRDHNNQLVSSGGVFANATVDGVEYNVFAEIHAGHYSLPVFGDATWSLGVNVPNFPPRPPLEVDVTEGASLTRHLVVSALPFIFSHPQPQTVTSGSVVQFFVSANSPSPLSFQWQVSSDDGATWTNVPDTAPYGNPNGAALSLSANLDLNGHRFRCVLTNAAGTATTNAATLTVTPPIIPPAISAHPFDATVLDGTPAHFSGAATGSPAPTLQWQISSDGTNWADLSESEQFSGTQSTLLQISGVTLDLSGHYFRLTATNTSDIATSIGARLTVFENVYSWQQRKFTPEQLLEENISAFDATPANDGLTNLFKYAFDLDPFTPGGGRPLPSPSVDGDTLSLTFEAIRSDVIYSVEASTDLVNWSTNAVSLSAEGAWRHATVSLNGGTVFLRIVVTRPTPE